MKRTPATTHTHLADSRSAAYYHSLLLIRFSPTVHAPSIGIKRDRKTVAQGFPSMQSTVTQLAAQGRIEALAGFDAEINRVIARLRAVLTKLRSLSASRTEIAPPSRAPRAANRFGRRARSAARKASVEPES
jgi:hypothetical protein